MRRILLVIGSLRQASLNRQLAQEIQACIGTRAETMELVYTDVPNINQDREWPAPYAVDRVRKDVASSDGIWFVSPEYNGSYPGFVKNLIDWLSRPTVQGDPTSPTSIAGKKVTVSGAAGRSGSRRMQGKLVELLQGVGANVMDEPLTGVVLTREAFVSDKLDLSDEDRAALAAQVEAFLAFIDG